jgi:hypothetical protein
MAGKVEDVHHAFPYGLAFECLADGDGLGEPRGTAVHALDSLSESVGFNFRRASRISWSYGGGHAIGG